MAEQFDYYAIESFIFKRFAGFEILKHRGFEVSEALGKIKGFVEQHGIEIDGLVARAGKIVSLFDKETATKGEGAILYDFPRSQQACGTGL